LTCIGCPLGCELQVNADLEVSGHECKIGEKFGKEESVNPTRNIATSITVEGGDVVMLSVKNNSPIPKDKIMDCVKAVKTVKVQAPVKVGDVVLKNAADTGVDFVATREVLNWLDSSSLFQ